MSRSAAGGCIGGFIGVLIALSLCLAAAIGVVVLVCSGVNQAITETSKRAAEQRAAQPDVTAEEKTEDDKIAPVAAPNPEDKLTLANFYKVKTGMTLAEAEEILGPANEILSEGEIGGYRTAIYLWKGSWGANCQLTIQNGKVVTKAQFGLK